MKRILALFLCGLICLSAAGCGKEEPFPSVATEPSVTQEPSTEPPETEPTEPPTEPDPDAPYRARAEEILSGMTTEEKVYQLFMVTPEALTGVNTATRAGHLAVRLQCGFCPGGGCGHESQQHRDRRPLLQQRRGRGVDHGRGDGAGPAIRRRAVLPQAFPRPRQHGGRLPQGRICDWAHPR